MELASNSIILFIFQIIFYIQCIYGENITGKVSTNSFLDGVHPDGFDYKIKLSDLREVANIPLPGIRVESLKVAIVKPLVYILVNIKNNSENVQPVLYFANSTSNFYCQVVNFEGPEKAIHISAEIIPNNVNILAVSYKKHIEIFAIQNRSGNCRYSQMLQKILLDGSGDIQRTILFKAAASNGADMPFLHMIVSMVNQARSYLVLFRWIDSAFHQVDEKMVDVSNGIEVSVLSPHGCNHPIIFVQRNMSDGSIENTYGLQVYQIGFDGKLELRQELLVNYTHLDVYAINCENYNFLACGQGSSCSIYSASATSDLTEFVEDRKIEYENRSPRQVVYTNGLIVLWEPVNQTQGQMKLRGFLDSQLNRSIDFEPLNYSNSTMKTLALDLWSSENAPQFLLLIYGDDKEVLIQLAELKLIKFNTHKITDGPADILQNIRSLILYQKLFLNKLISVVTKVHPEDVKHALVFENLRLNKTTILNGKVSTINVKNRSVWNPSRIQDRLAALQFSMRPTANLTKSKGFQKKKIYVKRLYLKNLNCNLSQIYADPYKNPNKNSSELVFGSNTIVNAKGMHTKKLVETSQLQYRDNEETIDDDLTPISLKLFQSIKVNSLVVRNLNKMNFTRFYRTAFFRNRDDFINGSIIFKQKEKPLQTPISCKKLTVETLNTRSVKDFFTLNSDQIVHSNLFVRQFLAFRDITINTINGRNVSELGFVGEKLTVNSPAKIESLTVFGDLTISASDEPGFYDNLRAASAKRVESFTQIYNGEVRISGKLSVTDLKVSPRGESIVEVPGTNRSKEVIPVGNLNELFWMRNFSQIFNIASIQFIKSVQVSDIDAESVNNHQLTNYLLRIRPDLKLESLTLHMKSVKILGNLNTGLSIPIESMLLQRNFVPIEEMSADLIRRTNTLYPTTIFGIKRFSKTARIRHFSGRYLNSLAVQNFVQRYSNNKRENFISFYAPKRMMKLRVLETFSTAERIDIGLYNRYNLSELFNNGSLHRILDVRSFQFAGNTSADNIQVHKMNGISFSAISHTLSRSTAQSDSPTSTLGLEKPVLIKGAATFKGNLTVERLNNIIWNQYKTLLTLNDNQTYPTIGGTKIFHQSLLVHLALDAVSLNDLNVNRFFRQSLRKSGGQTILAPWTLGTVNITHLSTRSVINGVRANHLVRINSAVYLIGNLQVTSANLQGSAFGDVPTNSIVKNALNRFRSITNPSWSEIRIRQDVSWPDTVTSGYDTVRDNAVRYNSRQGIIGTVHFKTTPLLKIVSHGPGVSLGGVNLSKIADDCLVSNTSTPLVISSRKYFEKLLGLSESINLRKSLDVAIMNSVNVLKFNQTIYRSGNSVIQVLAGSKKIVTRPIIGNLVVQGSINSVKSEQLVFAQSTETLKLPSVSFKEVSTNLLTITRVHNIDLTAFLHGRVRRNGESQKIHGSFTFEKLITKTAIVLTINGLSLDRVVLKNSETHQIIYGSKSIASNSLQIFGPCSILNANGAELIQKYHNSILTNRNHKVKTIEVFGTGKTTFMHGINLLENNVANATSTVQNIQNISRQLEAEDRQALEHGVLFVGTPELAFLETSGKTILNVSSNSLHYACGGSSALRLTAIYDDNIMTLATYSLYEETRKNQKVRIDHQNDCSTKSSRLQIQFSQSHKTFKFSSTIENLWTFKLEDSLHIEYALIEFQNKDQTRVLCLLRIDPIIEEIKPIQEISTRRNGTTPPSKSPLVFPSIQTKLYKISSQLTLLFSTEGHQQNVYQFDSASEQFLKVSSLKFSGDLVVQLVNFGEQVTSAPRTLVANRGQKIITVYNQDLGQIIQQISVPRAIENLIGFDGGQEVGFKMMVATTQDSYFYVYRYKSSVEGWTYVTYGVLSDSIEHILITSKSGGVAWLFPKVMSADKEIPLLPEYSGNTSSVAIFKLYTQHGGLG
ncbi:unnamed protein product [Hermetia illucens]|uniref:Uncharacterized protein n=1 Tax=Hermetia illucens TaxID=343691 RepID=A0A7R8V9J2_HERIL|nr:unnamed protein product [Hermetia illucens]